MKILLTADWHLKYGQKNVPKEWARNRYGMFFDKIAELEKSVDLHVVSGDIFDRTPTLEELATFNDFVRGCSVPTFINTGNHEAETKKRSFFEHLKNATGWINPDVHIVTEISTSAELGFSELEFYVVPYEFIKRESTWKELNPWPVFTHVRGEIPPHVKPEIPLEWLEKFPVVFAGDLHSHGNCQGNIVYPGSPMTTSFHRNETKNTNGYIIIDTDDWSWKWHDFELPQLIRKTITDKADMVATDFHHTIYELEGTMDSLSEKVDSELLDKKIVKRSSESALILTEEMSLEDELVEYLQYILGIKDVKEVLTAYHEHS